MGGEADSFAGCIRNEREFFASISSVTEEVKEMCIYTYIFMFVCFGFFPPQTLNFYFCIGV